MNSAQNDIKIYELAQNSAQFHDKLMYTVLGIVITLLTALYGWSITSELINDSINYIGSLGILVSGFGLEVLIRYSSIKRAKYDVCKKIEEDNKSLPRNHLNTPDYPLPLKFIPGGIFCIFIYIWLNILTYPTIKKTFIAIIAVWSLARLYCWLCVFFHKE